MGERRPGRWRTQRKTAEVILTAKVDATSISNFQERCKAQNVSGGVHHPFWEGFPHCNIHMAITPDILRQLYQGIVKHLIHWCSSLMTNKELDDRICRLPPCFGVRHFKHGWSQLSQISGTERKDMARILLGKVPSQVVMCYRALLDFIYIAQYASHDDTTIQYPEDSPDLYHANKHIFVHLGVREHLNIPKFHSMLHYAECIRNFGTTNNYNTKMFKRFHVDFAKEGWRVSNSHDKVPQMTQWLSRQEKVAMFESYLN
ncbi:hypothetical protein SERLA73DRAFT_59635, partial [Serpula lacrymans var. lacrymans S7.3]